MQTSTNLLIKIIFLGKTENQCLAYLLQ